MQWLLTPSFLSSTTHPASGQTIPSGGRCIGGFARFLAKNRPCGGWRRALVRCQQSGPTRPAKTVLASRPHCLTRERKNSCRVEEIPRCVMAHYVCSPPFNSQMTLARRLEGVPSTILQPSAFVSGPRPAFCGVFLVCRYANAPTFLSFFSADSKAAALCWRKEQDESEEEGRGDESYKQTRGCHLDWTKRKTKKCLVINCGASPLYEPKHRGVSVSAAVWVNNNVTVGKYSCRNSHWCLGELTLQGNRVDFKA